MKQIKAIVGYAIVVVLFAALLALELAFIAMMVVAVVGITLNLTVLVKERERELAILRAVGTSIWQIVGLVLVEAFLLAALSVGIGIVAGCALAFVLTEVINKTFFGWTIPLQIPWEQLGSIPLVLLPIALLAGLAPAIQAGRTAIVEAIRA